MTSDPQSPFSDEFGSTWLRRVRAIEIFEEQWQQHGEGKLAEVLTLVEPSERTTLLHELVCVDLEFCWERGKQQRVERYIDEFPELLSHTGLPRDVIVEELRIRRRLGYPASKDELEQRFPGQADELLRAAGEEIPTVMLKNVAQRSGLRSSRRGPGGSSDGGSLPRQLGRYELRELIGRGGFARVYRAWDPTLRREVAVKVGHAELLSDPGAVERMQREAQSVARLRHPVIVPVYEVGEHDGQLFIVSALVSGPSLAEHLRHNQPTPRQAATWILRIAEGLEYAHQSGIVHRDIKPSNILIDAETQPVLVDFGLARDTDIATTLTLHGDVLGTPGYMSPEQAQGHGHQVDGRTDLYALGVVLYEMLCGKVPFQGNVASVLHKVIHEEPQPPRQLRSHVPLDLETICLKAMSKEPGRRYATAGAMADDLRAYLDYRPISARRLGAIGRLARWCQRNPALATTIAVALLALAITGAVSYTRVVRERDRYLAERETAVANLYHSLVREAHSIRLTRRTGYRAVAWDRIRQAMQLETPVRDVESLRQEAVACLGDFVGNQPLEWPYRDLDWVSTVTVHPNNRWVAVSLSKLIQLREVQTGRVLTEFRDHQAGVFALSFSADGRTLASMDDAAQIKIRRLTSADDPTSWEVQREIQGLVGHERGNVVAVSCVLTPGGESVLACAKGEQRVRKWNIASGEVEHEFRGLAAEPFVRATLSPDGKLLVGVYRTAEMDGVVIWNVATGELVRTLPISPQALVDVSFSGDGSFLACAGINGTYILDTDNWSRQTSVRSDDQFFTIAFHPHRPVIAIPTTRTATIRLWDVVANHEVALLEHPDNPHSVAFSPDGSLLVTASQGSVRLWNLNGAGEKRVVAAHQGITNHVRFSPDGKLLASAGTDTFVRIWDANTLRPLSRFSVSPTALGKVHAVAFSPDSKRLAAVDWSGGAAEFDITNPESPQRVTTLTSHETKPLGHIIWDVAYSPDGRYLAAAGQSGVWIWQDGKRIAAATNDSAMNVAFTRDSKRIAWRAVSRWQIGVFHLERLEAEPVHQPLEVQTRLTFFGDEGQLLLFRGISESDNAPLYAAVDPQSGKSQPIVWDHIPSLMREIDAGGDFVLSSDQSRMAVMGSSITIWDLPARCFLVALPLESTPINSLAFNPDCTQLVLGLTDGTIVVWHLPTVRRQLAQIGLDW
jgi:WD40 repeat protein